MDVDLAVVGAGGAGLSLIVHLERLLPAGRRPPAIVLIDPVHRVAEDRTWCFWDAGSGPLDHLVHRSWRRVAVVDTAGGVRVLDLDPLRYVMIRSADFYAHAEAAARRLRVTRIAARVHEVGDGVVRAGSEVVRARWVVDSRPAAPRLPANTALLQHFRGWAVRFGAETVDPDLPLLMDFSVQQPAQGVGFGYVLPTDPRTALVEYTEFSAGRRPSDEYDEALRAYLRHRLGAAPGGYTVERVEDGAIPMTDAVCARRAGPSAFRLGTAGGATRGSTGYAFAAIQRQASAVAQALIDGQVPVPPRAYPRRHRWMDAVLLRALDQGLVAGPTLFADLFARNPPERVLRFLDGRTTPGEELRLMATTPILPMTRAAAADAVARVARRIRPLLAGRSGSPRPP
ncbi:MAG TPA: lycopene cyclase family protein [Kineosporiaceae bacterium]